MELAALATRAVPGLSPTGVADAADDARDFTSAVVTDASGNRWRVRSPHHPRAAMRLETEVQVLRGFSTTVRAELPFRVPSVAGATRVDEMRIFVYNHLPGTAKPLEKLVEEPDELITSLGRTTAAIHGLSPTVVDSAQLPRYSAERIRQRRLNELDAAAASGKVPAALLRRWERAMEDKELWGFTPTVVHGDLHEDNLLIEGSRVVAVTGWTDLHLGDPADDLAWLIAAPKPAFSAAVMAAYREHLTGEADEHLLRRAALSAEFALAQWLVRGQSESNEQMVSEAESLLKALASDVETYGGRPLALDDPDPSSVQVTDEQETAAVARAGAAATVTGWTEEDDDGEPAVITDAAVADDQPTEEVKIDPSLEDVPASVEDHFSYEAAEEITPVAPAEEPAPTTGSLPIQPDAESEKRAKQRNFFPTTSAGSAASADSATSAEPLQRASSPVSVEESEEPQAEEPTSASSSLYDRHPGLRPPGA